MNRRRWLQSLGSLILGGRVASAGDAFFSFPAADLRPKPKPVEKPKSQTRLSYPTPPWRTWSHPGTTRRDLINHLLTHGNHAGNWTRETLEQLTYAELSALHSDHHDGRVKPFTRVQTTKVARQTTGANHRSPAKSAAEYCPPNAVF